ncbi:MAG TPA: DUF2203 domain-containing protein [Anaeromyxobacter sp.]|nr:DUF2203 domain-containing protein [Anaeromyxobacter sp.]
MEDGPRYFTVEEANGLIGALEIEFGRVAGIRGELAPLVESFGAELAMEILQERSAPLPGREADAARMTALAAEITAAVERINGLGCLVKDLEAGLVDFYAIQDDEPVFLCWQYGEPAVTHWHNLDEGFAGRKPIEGIEVRPPSYLN